MMQFISIRKLPTFYNVTLDGNSLTMNFYYNKTLDRYFVDISNLKNGQLLTGAALNVNANVIESAGRLGLQSLVPVSLPKSGLEATHENWGDGVRLVYMDNETWRNIRYGAESNVPVRPIWNV